MSERKGGSDAGLADAAEESALVRRAAHGDERAWARLVDRHGGTAFRVARSVVARDEDAEDVVQEALLTSLRQLAAGTVPHHFHAWFMRIVWTRAVNYARREALRRTEQISSGAACARTPSPDQAPERSEFWRALGDGLQGLSDVRRRAFLMYDVEGWKHREIAETLGLRGGTARMHVTLARRALRASMAEHEPALCNP